MDSLLITVGQVLILALEIGTGYVLAKRGKISADAVGILNYLCSNLALPCAIFLSAAGLELTADSWGEVRLGVALIIASAAVQIGVSTRLFRKERFEERVVYQLGTVYGNSAFMGIPIATAVIGDEAVLYVVLLMIIDTVCLFIHSSLAAADGPDDCGQGFRPGDDFPSSGAGGMSASHSSARDYKYRAQ